MKKIIKVTTLVMTTLLAGSSVAPVFAATVKEVETKGSVIVQAPGDPTGDLKLEAVPDLDFGATVIGTKKTLVTDPATVQTSDFRATGAGWELSVKYDTTSDKAWVGDSGFGQGFILSLPALTYAPETDLSNVGTKPTPKAVSEVNDVDAPVETAALNKTEGMGTWIGSFDPGNTTLDIPVNNIASSYQANLVWTLSDTPA